MNALAGLLRRNRLLPAYLIVVALLIVLLVTGGVISSKFLTVRNFSNLFQQMIVLGVVSLGRPSSSSSAESTWQSARW